MKEGIITYYLCVSTRVLYAVYVPSAWILFRGRLSSRESILEATGGGLSEGEF